MVDIWRYINFVNYNNYCIFQSGYNYLAIRIEVRKHYKDPLTLLMQFYYGTNPKNCKLLKLFTLRNSSIESVHA